MSTFSRSLAGLAPGKLAAVTFAAFVLGSMAALGVLYATAVRDKDEGLRRHVRDLTVTAAALVSVDDHERILATEDFRADSYNEVLEPLVRFHRAHPSIQYLWTVRVTEEGHQLSVIETSVDEEIRTMQLAAGRSQDLLPFLGPNTETVRGRASIAALQRGEAVVFPGIYEDEHGAYIEARAPLLTRDGRFVGYVGVDYALDSFSRQLNEVRWVGALALALALLVSAVIARSAYFMRRQSLAYLAAAEEQRDLARRAQAAKGQLLAVATHDLKNPLSAIVGLTGLWRKARASGTAPARAEEDDMLETIHSSAGHMNEIVRGILVSEGIEQGGLPFEPKPTDLAALASEVLRFNLPAATRKSIELRAELPPELRATVDVRGMRECFDNYLSNAVKFSPPGRTVTVGLRVDPVASEFEFFVLDQGPGLVPKDRERLFGKFQRLTARPTGGEFSTGLGLSIVKTVTELHGGRVGCESEPGQGARFWLRCPLVASAANSRSPRPPSASS